MRALKAAIVLALAAPAELHLRREDRPVCGPSEERGITDMVGQGFISDGDFSAMLQNVFEGRNARISFGGEESLEGRKTLRYRFEIPQGSQPVGDMFRACVRYRTTLGESITCVRSRIAGREVLLPSLTEKRTDALNRPKYFNRAVFNDCHEFAAQSTITFGAGDEALEALPANLNLELRLEAEIDIVSAWEGSEVRATLLKAVGPLQEGAELTGAIRGIERRPGPNASVRDENLTHLDYGRGIRVIGDIALENRCVPGEGFREAVGGVEQEVAHCSVGGLRAR